MTTITLIQSLPEYFSKLIESEFVTRDTLPMSWRDQTGIYVFYENGKAIYVGRGRNLRGRIMQHSRPSVKDTPLAFKLTAEALEHTTSYRKGEGRSKLKEHGEFPLIFKAMKQRITKMQIKAIVIDDDPKGILSHIFEAYAVSELNTKYNSFLTT